MSVSGTCDLKGEWWRPSRLARAENVVEGEPAEKEGAPFSVIFVCNTNFAINKELSEWYSRVVFTCLFGDTSCGCDSYKSFEGARSIILGGH